MKKERISHSFPSFDANVVGAAAKALEKGNFSRMEMADRAERKLATFTGAPFAVLTGTGFSAIQAALLAHGIKPKQEVFIPTITCPAVYHAIRATGATPVVVDVATKQPLISEQSCVEAKRGAWVLVPQMFGLRSDVSPFFEKGFQVFEDCAQSFARGVNPQSTATILSFSPTKLMTAGYVGAVLVSREKLLQNLRCLLDIDHFFYERDFDPTTPALRMHSPVSDFQAAMLLAQLDRYEEVIQTRNRIVQVYDEHLSNPERLRPAVPFRYSLLLHRGGSEKIAAELSEEGISAKPLGSHLLHRTLKIEGNFSNAEYWYDRTLSLPLHENVSLQQAERIAKVVRRYL